MQLKFNLKFRLRFELEESCTTKDGYFAYSFDHLYIVLFGLCFVNIFNILLNDVNLNKKENIYF